MKKKTDWVKKVSLLGLLITAGTGLNALAATNSVADNMGVSTQKPSFESSLESLGELRFLLLNGILLMVLIHFLDQLRNQLYILRYI